MDSYEAILYLSIVISVVAGILVFIGIYSYGHRIHFGISSENLEYGYQSILMYCLVAPLLELFLR
ncbi:MAG: hypothetical protein ACLRQF_19680 [Thomasclavelia ramosa]